MSMRRTISVVTLAVVTAQSCFARQPFPYSRRVNATVNPGLYEFYEPTIAVSSQNPSHIGTIDAADVATFGDAFIAGAPVADVNADQVVNAQDVTCFLESLTCGCAGSH